MFTALHPLIMRENTRPGERTIMRISSSSGMQRSSSNPGKKAALRKQIRKLEKEKKEIMKKLGMGDGMKSENIVKGAVAINEQTKSVQASEASAGQQATVSTGESGSVTIQAPSTPILQQNNAPAPAAEGGAAAKEDPKELMKKFVLLEMQIMELKKQLGEDSSPNTTDDDDNEEQGQANVALPAADAGSEPAGDGGGEIHVNEYA